jgi:hypothetical protein
MSSVNWSALYTLFNFKITHTKIKISSAVTSSQKAHYKSKKGGIPILCIWHHRYSSFQEANFTSNPLVMWSNKLNFSVFEVTKHIMYVGLQLDCPTGQMVSSS